ncbi:MAG: hypothetical protein ACPGSB_03120 [Opitutales bacterium]
MDNLLEILVPLIFAAIYFFGSMFGKSKDDEDAPPGQPRRRGADEQDADAVERQRRIQEEIRRKIMERRRSAEGSQTETVPSGQELRERREEVEAPQESRQVKQETSGGPPPLVGHAEERQATPPTFSWDESDNAYGASMQAQLKQIEATKRRAEKLKNEAAKKRKDLEGTTKAKRRSGGYFTGPVRESLQDPQAARVAFIYGEVLGQPVSLRKGQSVPGLN